MSKKIIVVGAGMAGLAACTQLIKDGFEAIILEARNHSGGRAYSEKTFGFSFGYGASWIHGNENNPIALLANQSHTDMVVVDPKKFMTFGQYGPIPPEPIEKFNKKFDLYLTKAKKFAYNNNLDISLEEALSNFVKLENFSSTELALFKSKLHFFESYIGDSYEFLSARHWDEEESWPGDNCFLTSSYQSIINELSKNCEIKLNNIVKKININKNNVEIITENNMYSADAAIVTLPLGVLKKNVVTFNPSLPANKQKAIENLGMGLFNITAIKFPFSFWPDEAHALFYTELDDLSISTFFNLHHFINVPILVGYTGGKRAKQLETFSDESVISKTINNFKKIFGGKIPEPEAYINTRWSLDPFAYGSYSYFKIGASSTDCDVLAQSVSNRLFFAGEASSSKYLATTHGAYLSGIREAKKIKDIFLRN